MNIVMVGARAFPVVKAGVAICELLAPMARDTQIFTRGGERGADAFIAEAASIMGFPIRRWPAEGGPSNFIRDVEMVKAADAVYAFFDADHVGEGGTQHVVDKALDQHKRTYCYTWDGWKLVLIASDDGEGELGDPEEGPRSEAEATGEAQTERASRRSTSPQGRRRPVWPGE